jgi:hypothetical protein
MKAMRSATITIRRSTPASQADPFPELSGGNAGVGGAVESPAGVTASPPDVGAAAPGLAGSDVSVMDFGHGL